MTVESNRGPRSPTFPYEHTRPNTVREVYPRARRADPSRVGKLVVYSEKASDLTRRERGGSPNRHDHRFHLGWLLTLRRFQTILQPASKTIRGHGQTSATKDLKDWHS